MPKVLNVRNPAGQSHAEGPQWLEADIRASSSEGCNWSEADRLFADIEAKSGNQLALHVLMATALRELRGNFPTRLNRVLAYSRAMDRFAALADPTRRRIIELLGAEEHAAGALGEHFEMSRPSVSHHLRYLRQAGLVRVRGDGQRRIYSLDRESLEEVGAWLEKVTSPRSDRLDALEQELRKKEKK
jgi:DNA-binding transcriptional ArsR family regulator